MKVATLLLSPLLLASQERDSYLAALAAWLAAADSALRALDAWLSLAVMAWVLHHHALSGDEKHLEAHVDARRFAGKRQGLGRHLSAGDTRIPAVNFPRDGDGFGRALEGT